MLKAEFLMWQYVLVLGSNIKPDVHLSKALQVLESKDGISILKRTELMRTMPLLMHQQPPFQNQGLLVETRMNPAELLLSCKQVEQQVGRQARVRFGPREIDIDIVWFSGGSYISEELTIPHYANRVRYWVRHIIAELVPHAKDADTGIAYQEMDMRPIMKVQDFQRKKQAGEKITVLTCYDFTFSRLLARTSLDAILVGDSLGMVVKGEENTLAVSVDDIVYHSRAVRRGHPDAFIIADMPWMSYHVSTDAAVENASRLIREGGANAIKLEGGSEFCEVIEKITRASIPVMGHIGLMPQSVIATGGYKLSARGVEGRKRLLADGKALENAGCFALVAEMIPAETCEALAKSLDIPVIGIGAGKSADGQVLVLQDMLGLDPDFSPKFLRKFANLAENVITATEEYCKAVRSENYPSDDESYQE